MSLSLEYNTERGKLRISEHGRIIQKLIEVAVDESDRERRQKLAEEIIKLMQQFNPMVKEVLDYKQKLWDHLFIMSDFKLDVDSPYPIPTPETVTARPEPMGYPQSRIKYRFYGKTVAKMIEHVAALEEGPQRTAYINAIGSFMKMSSKAWNLEMPQDNEVLHHLSEISKGKIRLDESDELQFKYMQQRKVQTIGGDTFGGQRNNNNKNRNNNFKKNRNFKNNNYKNRGN